MNIDFQKLVIQKHVIDSSTHEKSKKLSVAGDAANLLI